MFWVQLLGTGADGKVKVENFSITFSTIQSARAEARALAAINTYSWGKPTGFKVLDEAKRVVSEGSFEE
jgi:hypothetical protein